MVEFSTEADVNKWLIGKYYTASSEVVTTSEMYNKIHNVFLSVILFCFLICSLKLCKIDANVLIYISTKFTKCLAV